MTLRFARPLRGTEARGCQPTRRRARRRAGRWAGRARAKGESHRGGMCGHRARGDDGECAAHSDAVWGRIVFVGQGIFFEATDGRAVGEASMNYTE